MSLHIYPPLIIINIITDVFIPHRNFELITKKMSSDNIINLMEKVGYFRIDAINKNPRNNRNKIVFIVLKFIDNDLKKVKKIINMLDNDEIAKNNTLDEAFIILDKEFFTKKNFIDIIKELYSRQHGGIDINGVKPFYTICPYHNFTFNVPKCKIIYPHEIMTKEEVNELIYKEHINIKDLPTILTNDVTIIWNGARIGHIIRIIRKSESALESVYYRKVENAIH